MGSDGGVVEIDETTYGRAADAPQGRRRKDAKIPSSAPKKVILSVASPIRHKAGAE